MKKILICTYHYDNKIDTFIFERKKNKKNLKSLREKKKTLKLFESFFLKFCIFLEKFCIFGKLIKILISFILIKTKVIIREDLIRPNKGILII